MDDQNNHLYRLGLMSQATYKKRQREEAKRQEQCGSCMEQSLAVLVCVPCANSCYDPDEKTKERNLTAGVLSCGFYGALTTILGAAVTKSSAAVASGATMLGVSGVVGTIWCCLAKHGGCSSPDCDDAQQNEPHTAANAGPYIITTQPGSSDPDTSLRDTRKDPHKPSWEKNLYLGQEKISGQMIV